jgi:lysyl-tRNA synthetase class 2
MENKTPLEEAEMRLLRLDQLKKANINPFPSKAKRPATHTCEQAVRLYPELENQTIILQGRIRSIRVHGGSSFANIEDESGLVQIYFKKDEIGESYTILKDMIDVADFISVTGTMVMTHKGEKTLFVKDWELLTKSLLPLPEKWHGLSDTEIRYRKRYLDLISNPAVKAIFKKRSLVIKYVREFFDDKGFMEVETPVLQTLVGGALAKPFVTHHNVLDIDMYLRIAPELYLKRLIIGGYEKVYEIGRCFRNEGIDHSHNPEFTMIEFYSAYTDYKDLMIMMEEFMTFLLLKLNKSLVVEYGGEQVDFTTPWPRKTFREIVKEYADFDIEDYLEQEQIYKKAKELGVDVKETDGRGKIIDEVYKKYARPKIVNPIYLTDHPVELSPLAKKRVDDPRYVERFQLICAKGFELCNAFSELNDPIDQQERFDEQDKLFTAGDEEAMTSDADFVEALKHGMPPTAGLGMGVDRLIALLTDTHSLKEVIAFPTMKPKESNNEKINKEKEQSSENHLGINYDQAVELINQHVVDPHTRSHSRESEVIMKALAKKLGEDEEKWGIIGLLHDIDWDKTKQNISTHCVEAVGILRGAGATDYMIQSIISHAYGSQCGDLERKKRDSKVQHALACAETVTGLIISATLVRPDKKLANLDLSSLKKKFKDKKFAANCNREIIKECELIGLSLDEFLELSLKAVQEISDELGL